MDRNGVLSSTSRELRSLLVRQGLHTPGTDDRSYQILAVLSDEPLTNNFREGIDIRLLTKSSCASVLARTLLVYHLSATCGLYHGRGLNAYLHIPDFDCLQ
jgi:hypothetical protein